LEKSVENYFRVTVRTELVPQPFELASKFAVIIDFPIENQDHIAVVRYHRLVSRLKIDDL